MPASPSRRVIWPRPDSSSPMTSRRRSSSASRSTRGRDRWLGALPAVRSAAMCSRARAGPSRSLPQAVRGRTSGSRIFAVASPTTIVPGPAMLWSRAATFVVSPSTPPGARRRRPARPPHAGVDPDANVEVGDLPRASRPPRRTAVRRLRSRAQSVRALGVVLMGPGQAEESRDPVTHVRLHHAAELLHRMAHPADALADDKLGLVGAEALAEARGADDVREQRGHEPELVLRRRELRPAASAGALPTEPRRLPPAPARSARLRPRRKHPRSARGPRCAAHAAPRCRPRLTHVPLREPRSSTSSASPNGRITA